MVSGEVRPSGEPGRYMPTMAHICGMDGGSDASPVCGQPAIFHLFAGSPESGPSDWMMFSCEEHFHRAQLLAWDWHPVAHICDVPGTIWNAKSVQGEGFCYWPEAEAAIHEAVSVELATR